MTTRDDSENDDHMPTQQLEEALSFIVDGDELKFAWGSICRALEMPESERALRETLAGIRSDMADRTTVPESELYKLMLRSPNAEFFLDWVTEKVLPEIRKTGFYVNSIAKCEQDRAARFLRDLGDCAHQQTAKKGKG